jgi:hypothetical protein
MLRLEEWSKDKLKRKREGFMGGKNELEDSLFTKGGGSGAL